MSDCESRACPYCHDPDKQNCYQIWREQADQNGHYVDALTWPKSRLVKEYGTSEAAAEEFRVLGLEQALRENDEGEFAEWLSIGRARNWLIYRQSPETYLLVPDESGGKALEVLFTVTQANWDTVRQDLSIEQLRWIAILAIRLVENALLGPGESKDAVASTKAPVLAMSRVATEMERRVQHDTQAGNGAEQGEQ